MTDEEKRVKVIAGMEWALENMVDPMNDFRFSGYDGPAVLMNVPIIQDALEVLKEQEPIEPKYRRGMRYCGNCDRKLAFPYNHKAATFCWHCGKKVKWQ